ncbi:MAG: NUDIX domain-containing protein [Deltaproteobacteria bacterium]|nr:NUDIX domain-containing protein [Deltaproteobacteria bacterium]
MPAEAGIQAGLRKNWIPAFAGMTVGAIFPSASSLHISNPSAYSRGLFNSVTMQQVAQVLLFDRNGRLLVYLRDDKLGIPFPNHWDFFGGHLESGETPDQTLVREVKEELGLALKDWEYFRTYVCTEGDAYPNVKNIYWSRIDRRVDELTLREGQMLKSIASEERSQFRFANILGRILEDFVASGLWPRSVDNS